MALEKLRTEQKLISCFNPTAPVVESYRMLRTNLRFLEAENPLRTILITSSLPGEGKTLTSSNLAIAIAESGDPVVLVDGDLRRSSVHRLFGLDNRVGLTTVLAGEAGVHAALQETRIPKLQVLAAGPHPPNPAELLGLSSMPGLLRELASEAATVVVDGPPLIPVADAVVLASLVDGVALVLLAGKTPYQAAQRARAMLERAKARLLGVVLNSVPQNLAGYSQYYYSAPGTRSRSSGRRGKARVYAG